MKRSSGCAWAGGTSVFRPRFITRPPSPEGGNRMLPSQYASGYIRAFSVGIFLLLSGCDRFYGVETRASLNRAANVDCVQATLSGIPDAGRVAYRRSEARATEILPKQREILTVMHVWTYGEESARLILQINDAPDGWNYRNGRSRMNVVVPDEEIALAMPLMQLVNRTIEERCGLPVGNLQAEPVGETRRHIDTRSRLDADVPR